MPASVGVAAALTGSVEARRLASVMASDKFFSHARREFIARAMMDVVKLIFVAAVIGGFFVSAPLPVRLVSGVGLAVLFAMSVLTFPKKED